MEQSMPDPKVINYEESKIPPYTLPELLRRFDGTPVNTASEWVHSRRPELISAFQRIFYGQELPRPDGVHFEILTENNHALDGKAIRREIRLTFVMNNGRTHSADILMYVPKQSTPAPVFVGLNFGGNHTTTTESDVARTGQNGPQDKSVMVSGVQAHRWVFPELIARGYASITASYNDFFPDFDYAWNESALRLFFTPDEMPAARKTHTAIGTWSWGLSRMLDLAECFPEIDARRAAVHGHSRLGKTSLWTGALDRRFRLVCVNDAGCGGSALSRRLYGETFWSMLEKGRFSHWFVPELEKYMFNVNALPVDQHELVALVAPTPVAIHSATLDQWADPKGEYLAAWHAGPAYRLFGGQGLASAEPPAPDTPLLGDVSYLLRTGPHDQQPADWAHYLDLADRWL